MKSLLTIILFFSIFAWMFGVPQGPAEFTGADYQNPQNQYEIAVNELNNYVPVYERNISQDLPGKKVHGRTYFHGSGPGRTPKYVDIQDKHAFIVYHEMGHVLNPSWNETQCDNYAAQRDNTTLYEQGYSYAALHINELEGIPLGHFAPKGLTKSQRQEYCQGMADYIENM